MLASFLILLKPKALAPWVVPLAARCMAYSSACWPTLTRC